MTDGGSHRPAADRRSRVIFAAARPHEADLAFLRFREALQGLGDAASGAAAELGVAAELLRDAEERRRRRGPRPGRDLGRSWRRCRR